MTFISMRSILCYPGEIIFISLLFTAELHILVLAFLEGRQLHKFQNLKFTSIIRGIIITPTSGTATSFIKQGGAAWPLGCVMIGVYQA